MDTEALLKNAKNLDPDIARNISRFMSELSFTSDNSAELIKTTENIMAALQVLSKINMRKVVKNIKKLDPDLAENISDFVNALIKQFEKFDKTKIEATIKPIQSLLESISAVISTNVMKMKISLNPIRGWLIGR